MIFGALIPTFNLDCLTFSKLALVRHTWLLGLLYLGWNLAVVDATYIIQFNGQYYAARAYRSTLCLLPRPLDRELVPFFFGGRPYSVSRPASSPPAFLFLFSHTSFVFSLPSLFVLLDPVGRSSLESIHCVYVTPSLTLSLSLIILIYH